MEDVIPFVDANFRTIAGRNGRAIEGFSMGGRGALKLAFNHPDQFCSTIAYAGAASVFYKDEDGTIYHTYSTYARGLDMLNGAYHYMDLLPKGRDEAELPWTMAWLNYHDLYSA